MKPQCSSRLSSRRSRKSCDESGRRSLPSLRYGSWPCGGPIDAEEEAYTAEEFVAKLRQVEVLTAQGCLVAEAMRPFGVTEVTFRWRSEYSGRWA